MMLEQESIMRARREDVRIGGRRERRLVREGMVGEIIVVIVAGK